MKSTVRLSYIKAMFLTFAAMFLIAVCRLDAQPSSRPGKKAVKNIVIVHGAFADGSGWRAVYDILVKNHYNVSIVQNPLTSLKDDVNSANSLIDRQNGPVVLVGHSWGGMVITEAGVNPKVASLVYVAAFAPDKGESAGGLEQEVPLTGDAGFTQPDKYGLVYFEPAKFHSGFARDLSREESDFLCRSQAPIAGKCFEETVGNVAWKDKPSYGIVATEDKAISPVTERRMYRRAGAKVVELKGNHVIFISQPEAVAKVIMAAATGNSSLL
ncbi:alpha/beta hydrolase [Arachidicoccus terrestris]|uniref:alpha/beta hydrolase n=1 Tax=Arachidicoccus terrestris TaxID=2875539 RepID=UPI001CC54E02|nr:alpha/beta hydrolase [Arachidicoccus terrestris]UAY57084.1 alpha/beta hydrolase [Arachidicoccus terrestris]